MKLTKKLLREHRIFNSWGIAQALGNKIFLGYQTAEYGRMSRSPAWQVIGLDFQTDSKAPWYNNGRKTFWAFGRGNYREEKVRAFNEAVAWVKGTYGLEMTDRDPWGDYHPAGSLDRLKEILQEKVELETLKQEETK